MRTNKKGAAKSRAEDDTMRVALFAAAGALGLESLGNSLGKLFAFSQIFRLGHKADLQGLVNRHFHVHGSQPFVDDPRRFAGPAVGTESRANAVKGL